MDAFAILELVDSKLEDEGHKLLYLTRYGSHLYGTQTETSDEDFRGIFLPSRKSCLLGTSPKHFTWKDDLDVQVWSLQMFMSMLERGDTNAIDVLFSNSNTDAVIYQNPLFDLFRYSNKLLDVNKCHGFIGYALEQSKRFGVKTERYSVIKNIYEYLCHLQLQSSYDPNEHLFDYAFHIIEKGGNLALCYKKEQPKGCEFLHIGQSLHEFNITMDEFCERMTIEMNKYGKRTQKATENDGVDWKALSHSIRALCEMAELIETGKITFPLEAFELIRNIKCGILRFDEVEQMLVQGLENFYPGRKYDLPYRYDKVVAERIILDLYW